MKDFDTRISQYLYIDFYKKTIKKKYAIIRPISGDLFILKTNFSD